MADRRAQRREIAAPEALTEPAPAAPHATPAGLVLSLQRSAGNQAVGAMLSREPDGAAATATAPVPETEAQMDADVNFIAAKLQEQILTASEEQSIVDLVRKWADVDTDAIIRGEPRSPETPAFRPVDGSAPRLGTSCAEVRCEHGRRSMPDARSPSSTA